MALNDLLRSTTHEMEDALGLCEQQIRDLGAQRAARQEQGGSELQAELELSRQELDTRTRAWETSDRQLRALEAQLRELRQECAADKAAMVQAEQALEEVRKGQATAEKFIHRIDRDLARLVEDRKRFHSRLLAARREVFESYLGQFEERLGGYMADAEEAAARREAHARFEEARNHDPEVMTLWETYLDLRKHLDMSPVPVLRQLLQAKLMETQSQIEAAFPGALEALGQQGPDGEIEELFFMQRSDTECWAFLPVSDHTWQAIKAGQATTAGEAALRLMWAMGRTMDFERGSVRFRQWRGWWLMEVECEPEALDRPLSVPLPASAEVFVVPVKLPHEVEEAIRREESHD